MNAETVVIRTTGRETSFGVMDEVTQKVTWLVTLPTTSRLCNTLRRWFENDALWAQGGDDAEGKVLVQWAARCDLEEMLTAAGYGRPLIRALLDSARPGRLVFGA